MSFRDLIQLVEICWVESALDRLSRFTALRKEFHGSRLAVAILVGLEKSVRAALTAAGKKRGFSADKVIGIGVDTTGSSPIPVDARNVPLALDKPIPYAKAVDMSFVRKAHAKFKS